MPFDDPTPPEGDKPGDPTPPSADGPPRAPDDDLDWRRRALEAETAADELRAALEQAQRQVAQAHEALDACETRRAIDAALFETDALDLETARLMTEAAVARMPQPDVAGAVEELRRDKPFLFRAAVIPGAPAALSARADAAPGADLAGALEEAAVTGDRAALLRYLRLKRRF